MELAAYDRASDSKEEAERLSRLHQRQEFWHELEQIWDEMARISPQAAEYVALRRGDASTWDDFARLSEELGQATVLLSFFITGITGDIGKAVLFLLRPGWSMPHVIEVPLDQAVWEDLLRRFFREVHMYQPGMRRGVTWEYALRPLLDQTLIHLEGAERIILTPGWYGHFFPWGVLAEHAGWRTTTGELLPLIILPTLSVLPRLRKRSYNLTGPVLVLGNPIGDLPYAEEEAQIVAQHFSVRPLLRSEATKANVLARLAGASLIHLATHAFFDPDAPLESGIVLADGVLTAREVLEHRLKADLLVLSACESGQAGGLGGGELAGLSQVFFQAGVRSLLVSLWRVSDPATEALMKAFYTARRAGADKAQALRHAMTQIQSDPRWAHPYYWGAFILLGDWD